MPEPDPAVIGDHNPVAMRLSRTRRAFLPPGFDLGLVPPAAQPEDRARARSTATRARGRSRIGRHAKIREWLISFLVVIEPGSGPVVSTIQR